MTQGEIKMPKQFRMKKSQVPDQPEMRGRFMCAYLGCALWASTDDKGEPLDDGYVYQEQG